MQRARRWCSLMPSVACQFLTLSHAIPCAVGMWGAWSGPEPEEVDLPNLLAPTGPYSGAPSCPPQGVPIRC